MIVNLEIDFEGSYISGGVQNLNFLLDRPRFGLISFMVTSQGKCILNN